MKKYTTKAGQHSSGFHLSRIIPLTWGYVRKRKLYVWGRFDASGFYEHADGYRGWDKMFGGFNLQIWKQSDINSAMCATRCNWETGKYEITGYANIDGENVYDDEPWASVEEGLMVMNEYEFPEKNRVILKAYTDAGTHWNPVGEADWRYPVNIQAGAIISPWFGGSRPAPNNIELNVRTEWVKKSNQ